jgi:hypothetical protein
MSKNENQLKLIMLDLIMDQVDEILVPVEQTHTVFKFQQLTGKLVQLIILAEMHRSEEGIEAVEKEIVFVEAKCKELSDQIKIFNKICV